MLKFYEKKMFDNFKLDHFIWDENNVCLEHAQHTFLPIKKYPTFTTKQPNGYHNQYSQIFSLDMKQRSLWF